MGFFRNSRTGAMTERQLLTGKYNLARGTLIFVAVITFINLMLTATNSGYYFLFSASVPLILCSLGMFYCGMYPEEVYEELEFEMEFADKSLFAVFLAISIVIVALMLICWLLSKNQKGVWLLISLVLFGIDTICMFGYYGFDLTMLLDVLFHAYIIYSLVTGVVSYYKLKNLPADEFYEAVAQEMAANEGSINHEE